VPDSLNDIFINLVGRIKSLENRPRVSGGQSWSFAGTWGIPANSDIQNPSTLIVVDWAGGSIAYQDGFHIDPLDSTKLIVEHPGRYLLQWVINPGIIQPMLGPLLHVPLDLEVSIPAWWNFALALPAKGAYGDFSSVHYPSNAAPLDPIANPSTDASIQFSVHNMDSSNQIKWLQYRWIQIDYLGPISGPPFP
jgi:hypothetical protein